MKYDLTFYDKETDEIVYEKSFNSYNELEDELENWTVENHYYQIESSDEAA